MPEPHRWAGAVLVPPGFFAGHAMRILILEDSPERRTAMIEHLADRLPMFGVHFI